MRIISRIAATAMAITIAFAFMPFPGTANAASKKSVYVVSSTYFDFHSQAFTKKSGSKVKYNKKGLITKYIGAYSEFRLKYNKKYKVKQLKTSVFAPGIPSSVKKYTYKNGKMIKTVETSKESTVTTKYTYNGKKIIKAIETIVPKESSSFKTENKYTYKKKHVSKVRSTDKYGTVIAVFSFDKKGNVIKITDTLDGKSNDMTTNVITYNNHGKPKLIKSEYNYEGLGKLYVTTSKFTFKKIKVPAKYYNRIKEQQWKLINCSDGNDDGVSFAW